MRPFVSPCFIPSQVESHEGLEGATTSRSLPLQSRRNGALLVLKCVECVISVGCFTGTATDFFGVTKKNSTGSYSNYQPLGPMFRSEQMWGTSKFHSMFVGETHGSGSHGSPPILGWTQSIGSPVWWPVFPLLGASIYLLLNPESSLRGA